MARYMVVERILHGCWGKVYERYHTEGRMLPDGLVFVDSWPSEETQMVFQLMETRDERLFEVWTARWDDLVAFEIVRLNERVSQTGS